MACHSAGRIDEAAAHAREALELTRRLGARASEADALCLAGDVASTRGADEATGYYREALTLADALGMRPRVAHCHLGLGKLYRRTGTFELAQEHLGTATTLYREMDMPFWLEQAEVEASSWYGGAVSARCDIRLRYRNRWRRPVLAQMRSADWVRKRPLFGVDRT